MLTNLMVLPSLLLSLDKYLTTRSFKEPYFDAYEGDSETEWDDLSIEKSNAIENKKK